MLGFLTYSWNYIVNTGVDKTTISSEEAVIIKMTNRVFIFSSVFSLAFGIYLGNLDHYVPAFIMFGMFFTSGSVVFLNHFGHYKSAKLIYLSASNFCIYYFSSYLGLEAGIHLYVLISPLIVFSFFNTKDKISIALGLIIYFSTFLFLMETDSSFVIPGHHLSEIQLHVFFVTNIFFCVLLSVVLMAFLISTNSNYNKELLNQQKDLLLSHQLLKEKIAEHEMAQKKLQISESRLSTTLEAANQGLWDWNLTTNKVFFDKTWTHIMGYEQSDHKNSIRFWISLLKDQDLTYMRDLLMKHFSGEVPFYEIEYRAKTKAGEWLWIFSRGRVTEWDATGKPIRMMGTIQDISSQKQFQEELRKSKETAEDASRTRTQFLSIMSHEIRTPLNAVIGITHLLMEENPRSDQVENLHILKLSSENLLLLINDVLDFNKIEAGKIEFEDISFSLQTIINNIRHSFIHKAEERGIEFITIIDPQIPVSLMGDPTRTGQILTNLLSNAIKFTLHGKVTVKALLVESLEDSVSIDFSIIDTGVGISLHEHPNIFEPFTQANSSITRKFGGTGLGLAITKRLLELQNSHIHLESELGKGSKFSFRMSFRISTAKNDFMNSEKHQDLSGIRVLLVEDNSMNQLFTSRILKNLKADVDVASNGLIALEKILVTDYDIILMDLQMPEMDGFEATKEIRKLENNKYKIIPIIAVTAEASLDTKDMVLSIGMNDYITKPFNPNELNAKILKYIIKKEA